jgi:hypothetical protein
VLDDRANAVVAPGAAADPRLQPAQLEVALIVYDEDGVRIELEELDCCLHGPPGVVHERLGLEQRDLVSVDPDLGELAVELRAPGTAVPPSELVDDQPAQVVAIARVLPARVAEPYDEQVERGSVSTRPEPHQRFSWSGIVMLRVVRTKSGKDAVSRSMRGSSGETEDAA